MSKAAPATNKKDDSKNGQKKAVKGVKDDKLSDDTFEAIKVDARVASTAVLMLDSPEEEVLQKACESIFKFCEKNDNNRLQIHHLNATMKLFKLINHEDRIVQRNACMAFALLSHNTEIRRVLREDGIQKYVDKMISLLSNEYDTLVNEYAALWIKNACDDYSTKSIIVGNEQALNALVYLMTSNTNDPDICFNVLSAIDRLLSDFQTRSVLRELKGIEPIFAHLKSDYPQIQECAFSCLNKLTQDVENRDIIRDMNGLEKLVEFLSLTHFKDMHVHCLNVLANCLEDNICLDLIQQTGGLTKILAYCQEATDAAQNPQISASAAKALARCAKKQENRKILNEQQCEKTLIYLLLSENDDVKISACLAISIMCESAYSRDAFRNYEGIETLIRLCSSENVRVREMAILALSNLTHSNHNNCREILNYQGLESILNLLRDEKDTTKAYACLCLTNMSFDELLRGEIIQTQLLVTNLTVALSSKNTLAQSKACLTLASYCIDSAIRNELLLNTNSSVIQFLIELVKSFNDEVRNSSCWAITCASVDTALAAEFCKFGAIETLRDINQSQKRKSNFTDTALKKLLESNSSAKYALLNKIEATNFIHDGFYDMGPMRPNGKFYSLDELVKIPVNDKRPIIIVNAPEEKSPIPMNHESIGKQDQLLKNNKKEKVQSASSKTKETPTKATSKTNKRVETAKKVSSSSPVSTDEPREKSGIKQDQAQQQVVVYKPPIDKDLLLYISECRDLFRSQYPKAHAINLAKYVANKMGGQVARCDLNSLNYELPMNELKYELKTNIISLGLIQLGTYYHRALLFKVLADRTSLKVTLERGDYNRAWNTVALKDEPNNTTLKVYIVDLMHDPGRLMPIDSIEAIQYTKL